MNHLECAHLFFESHLQKGDQVIDATVGRGRDSLHLCQILKNLGGGTFFGFDIQKEAIDLTRNLLKTQGFFDEKSVLIHLILGSHATFQGVQAPISLIVYNLGYLPRGDKKLTTFTESTLQSLQRALTLLDPHRGALSILCYPGHSEGKRECEAVQNFMKDFLKNFEVSIYKKSLLATSPILFLAKQKHSKENIFLKKFKPLIF